MNSSQIVSPTSEDTDERSASPVSEAQAGAGPTCQNLPRPYARSGRRLRAEAQPRPPRRVHRLPLATFGKVDVHLLRPEVTPITSESPSDRQPPSWGTLAPCTTAAQGTLSRTLLLPDTPLAGWSRCPGAGQAGPWATCPMGLSPLWEREA